MFHHSWKIKGTTPTGLWADPDSVDGGGYNTSTTGNGCSLPEVSCTKN